MIKQEIILASQSQRRQELLSLMDIKFKAIKPDFDEDSVKFEDSNIKKYAIDIAEGKCLNVSEKNKNDIILGADTIVYLDNTILGKPKDKNQAYDYLSLLSGKTHKVITGIYFYHYNKDIKISDYSITDVTVQNLTDSEIKEYISSYTVLEAAGAYRIQDSFSKYILSLKGSYHNVVGLPVNKVYNCLKKIEKRL
ncbi:MAG: Maf family protein [Spirochaetota bacterium]